MIRTKHVRFVVCKVCKGMGCKNCEEGRVKEIYYKIRELNRGENNATNRYKKK